MDPGSPGSLLCAIKPPQDFPSSESLRLRGGECTPWGQGSALRPQSRPPYARQPTAEVYVTGPMAVTPRGLNVYGTDLRHFASSSHLLNIAQYHVVLIGLDARYHLNQGIHFFLVCAEITVERRVIR